MKRRCLVFMVVMGFAGFAFSPGAEGVGDKTARQRRAAPGEERPCQAMSFNIRLFTLGDGKDNWFNRRTHVVDLIKRHSPDIMGLQEVLPVQVKQLEEDLTDYEWFGVARDDGENQGERCPIFFLSSRFELLEEDTFWLSETPEDAGSTSWGAACRRIVTWGKFKDRSSESVFFFFNTHFDHVSNLARRESAKLLLVRVEQIAGDNPVVVTGDFNCAPNSEPYQIMTQKLRDSREISASPLRGPEGTSRRSALDSKVGRRIDYIFLSPNLSVGEYAVLDDTYGDEKRRPSDHMPVLVLIPCLLREAKIQ